MYFQVGEGYTEWTKLRLGREHLLAQTPEFQQHVHEFIRQACAAGPGFLRSTDKFKRYHLIINNQ